MLSKAEIMDRLQQHYDQAVGRFSEENVLGVFLYGSQNYLCDTIASDIDSKCILIPNLFHLAIAPYDVKHLTIDLGVTEEICECMSIMHMVENWKKQSINFLEIMFTDFYIINPRYYRLWQCFIVNNREDIARYDVERGVKSIVRQAQHTIAENPENGKKIGNAIRLLDTLQKYIDGRPYKECIIPNQEKREEIIAFKNGEKTIPQGLAQELHDALEELLSKPIGWSCYGKEKSVMDIDLVDFILELIKERIKEI